MRKFRCSARKGRRDCDKLGGCGRKRGGVVEEGSTRKGEQRRDPKARPRMWAGGRPGGLGVCDETRTGGKGTRAARGAAVPAEIVQDAAGNLHPFGLHDEGPQQGQCIPAPRGRALGVRHGDYGSLGSGR